MRRTWHVTGWIALVLLAVLAYAGHRVIWSKPFTVNELANRQALEFLIGNPELFTPVRIADGTIFDYHSGRLAASSLRKRDDDYLKDCHAVVLENGGAPLTTLEQLASEWIERTKGS
jgi:hypothetical protein